MQRQYIVNRFIPYRRKSQYILLFLLLQHQNFYRLFDLEIATKSTYFYIYKNIFIKNALCLKFHITSTMIKVKKITAFVATILFASTIFAQQDSLSQTVVLKYLDLLNYRNLPNKVVYMESKIIDTQIQDDTLYMKRWFYGNNFSRIELTYRGEQTVGYCSNGKEYWHYLPSIKQWDTLNFQLYYDSVIGFDYRKPLHSWEARSLEFTECVEMKWEGQVVYRVTVLDPEHLDRYYMFEKSSGLLFLMMPVTPETGKRRREVDWRAINEYIPIDGVYLFPSVESYQSFNSITIYFTKTELIPFDSKIFEINN